AAHDGNLGLATGSFTDWMFRDDPSVQLHQGDTFSGWGQASGSASGRAYMGFGASSAGTYSIVMAPNTGQFQIQYNQDYFNFIHLASVNQIWLADHWYKIQVQWGVGGTITANLFDSDGVTLLNTVSATDNNIASGGIAFRAFTNTFGGDNFFDTVGK